MIPCFNYGSYLQDAVRSALEQEGGRPHVVVVDDGSTDAGTLAELGRLPEGVELVRQDNRGVCAARNAGLWRARGEYVSFPGSHVKLLPGSLAARSSSSSASSGACMGSIARPTKRSGCLACAAAAESL